MKTQMRILLIAVTLVSGFLLQGCMKDRFNKPAKPGEVAKDNAIAEKAFSDMSNQVKAGMSQAENETEGGKSYNLMNNDSVVITISPYDWTTFPKTITVDYGTGCLGNDGVLRTGKVIIHTTGWYREHGTVITVTPDDYTVNGVIVEGQQTITNNGLNANNNLSYTVITDGSVTTPEGTIMWNSNLTSEWIAGEPTLLNPWDDEYLVTGTQHGYTVNADEYDIVILQPLHIKTNCTFVVAGELKMTADGYQDDIFVNYGNGDCDNIVYVTYMGQTYTIIMQ
jgi:hypothetical protein